MYTIYRKDYYKKGITSGIKACVAIGIPVFIAIFVYNIHNNEMEIMVFAFFVLFTLYFFIKFYSKSQDFLVLRIDEDGIFLCPRKDEGVFVSWDKIRYVIFVIDSYGSKMIVRQYSKDTHYFLFADYFFNDRPRKVIDAARENADDEKKVREVKDSLGLDYEGIMFTISKTEIKRKK